MKVTSKKQAIAQLIKDLEKKFKAVNELQSIQGIHLGDVVILACEGYGPSTDESMYTPSVLINVKLVVARSSQGRLKINKFLIDGNEQKTQYGGSYIANIIDFLKKI